MLEQAAGLSDRALEAIADLERRVVEADGGRLKLEWGRLRSRRGDQVDDLLWWDDDRLLGFLGFYSYGSSLELAGMVEPAARRRGIATALLDAAASVLRERAVSPVLLIVPRASKAGKALALRRGAVLDHSEHAMVLDGDPSDVARDADVSLRPAVAADIALISRLLEDGFGEPAHDDLASQLGRTLVVERSGSPIGTLMVNRDEAQPGVYGFVIDAQWRGQGIGRDVLRRVCEQLRADGATRLRLDVAVDNDGALAVYSAVGFLPLTTEDYYALPGAHPSG